MIRTAIHFRLPNSPGALATVVARLKAAKIRIVALSLEAGGTARMVVDQVNRAAEALAQEHVKVDRHDVLFTRVSAASLGSLLTAVANAGVNLEYVSASAPDGDGLMTVVLGVEDALRASLAVGI